jgi:CRISPR/Cas system CSM-associated protein Csm2 small subunit
MIAAWTSGPIEWLDSDDSYKRALARLLEAVLAFHRRYAMIRGG